MAMMAAAPVATVASIRTTWQLAMSGGSRRKCSWRQEGGRRGRGEGGERERRGEEGEERGRGGGREEGKEGEERGGGEEAEENEGKITTCFYSCYLGLASCLIGLNEDLADCWVLAN